MQIVSQNNSQTLSNTQYTRQTDPLTEHHIKYKNITSHSLQLIYLSIYIYIYIYISSVYSPFSDRVGLPFPIGLDFLFITILLKECQWRVMEQIFTTGCPSWRRPHAWDVVSNSYKYCILSGTHPIQSYKCVCTIPTLNININLHSKPSFSHLLRHTWVKALVSASKTQQSTPPPPSPSPTPVPSAEQISDDSTFNVTHTQFNANGIGNKLTELGVVLKRNKVKVAVIHESKLSSKSKNPCIRNYTTVRKDRPHGHGGGLLVFIHESITFSKSHRHQRRYLIPTWKNLTFPTSTSLQPAPAVMGELSLIC